MLIDWKETFDRTKNNVLQQFEHAAKMLTEYKQHLFLEIQLNQYFSLRITTN